VKARCEKGGCREAGRQTDRRTESETHRERERERGRERERERERGRESVEKRGMERVRDTADIMRDSHHTHNTNIPRLLSATAPELSG
jgi:hypothetical protein